MAARLTLGLGLLALAAGKAFNPCSLIGDETNLSEALEKESVLRQLNFRICMGRWVRRTLLHEAAQGDRFRAASLLLRKGATVDVEDGDGWTPFVTAVMEGHLTMAQFFLDNFGDVDHPAFDGRTALMMASSRGQLKTCSWLLSNGASLHKKDLQGNTALLLAAQQGHLEVALMLHDEGLSLEEADENGWTPLVWAVKTGRLVLTDRFLKLGASQREDQQGNRPLLWPLKSGDLPMAQLLLDHGADIYRVTADGMPAYMASGSAKVNDFMLRSRWKALFTNFWVALALIGGCLVGGLATYVQLNAASIASRFPAAYDLIPWKESPVLRTSSGEGSPRAYRTSTSSGGEMDVRWKNYLWPQFYHGAFLKAAGQRTSLLLFGQIMEVEATAVLFGFGLVVVRWYIWLPLHLLIFVPPCVQYWRPLVVLKEPALLVGKIPALPGLVLMIRATLLWLLVLLVSRPSDCQQFSSYTSWAQYLCALEGSGSSSWFHYLADPQWGAMLMKQTIWKRQHFSGITGCYFLMLGVGYLGYMVSLAEHTYHQKKRLSIEVQRVLQAVRSSDGHSSNASVIVAVKHLEELQTFRQQLRIQVVMLLVDTLLHVNTVLVLLWTGYFALAFLQTAVIARSISLQVLLGRLRKLPEALRESEKYGMVRKDLLEIMAEQRGFQAFVCLCLTAYGYWYCVENAYHAFTLLISLVLSTQGVAEHLHQRVDFDMELESTPSPMDPTGR